MCLFRHAWKAVPGASIGDSMDNVIVRNLLAQEERIHASDSYNTTVEQYTKFFQELARPSEIFGNFRKSVPSKTHEGAKVIGSLWYHLSEAIVDVLCTALAKLENPKIRHFVIQTAYEELGEDSEDKIHTDLLRESLRAAGVTDVDILTWSGAKDVHASIESLYENLNSCISDEEICGVLLGMEIIAYENIANVVDYLDYSDDIGRQVRATEWVRLHNTLEEAHIHRSVSVFVRHVSDFTSRRKFVQKFMQTMEFWNEFWAAIARTASAPAA